MMPLPMVEPVVPATDDGPRMTSPMAQPADGRAKRLPQSHLTRLLPLRPPGTGTKPAAGEYYIEPEAFEFDSGIPTNTKSGWGRG